LSEEKIHSQVGGYTVPFPEGWFYVDVAGMTIIYENEAALQADVPSPPIVLIEGGSLEEIADGLAAGAGDAREMAVAIVEGMQRGEGKVVAFWNEQAATVGEEAAFAVDITGAGLDAHGTLLAGRVLCLHRDTAGLVIMGFGEAHEWASFAPTFETIVRKVTLLPLKEPELVQVRQWAKSAEASSQYGDLEWAASQATGAPDTRKCGDYGTAWASFTSSSVEWIELRYDYPVLPVAVEVVQSNGPSQVSQVELIDEAGQYHEIYSAEPEIVAVCPYTLSISVSVDYRAVGVRITLDQTQLRLGWNAIDAVELVGLAEEHPSP
jgi:hypothetical protein